MKNLVFILTDQLSRSVLPLYSSCSYGFDNIARLQSMGTSALAYHTPSAVCTPSRGCVLTGLTPFRHGAYRNGLPVGAGITGAGAVLKACGCSASYIGKWHLGCGRSMGDSLREDNLLGFDFIGPETEMAHAKSVSPDGAELHAEIQDGLEYTTDYLCRRAVEHIRSVSSPFALFISFPDPHQPYLAGSPYCSMYSPYKMEVPASFYQKEVPDWAEDDEWGRKHYFPPGMFERTEYFQAAKAQYLGMVRCIDAALGRILDSLEDRGLMRDTVVVFTSDHGDYLGLHGLMEKNNLYDDVYSPPLIIASDGLAGTCASPVSAEDLMHTVFSLMGLDSQIFPGEDLSRCFTEGLYRYKDLFIYPSDVPRAGIITDEYKLCFVGMSYDGKREFRDHILFDRKKDPDEMDNLFGRPGYEEITARLAGKILARMQLENVPEHLIPRALAGYAGRDNG